MSNKRYPEEFKIEAVKQVTERGHSAPDVAKRLGVSQPTLYEWMKKYALAPEERRAQAIPEHVAALEQHGIPTIDMVVVNLYPFQQTVAKDECALKT
ncbi:transposase, partial [Herbaspirillum sp. B65]|uniref:transposase n=1 Tax=Herbaspirillum sp. B65 TaxID=137708 RepID=UPI0011D1C5E0